MLAGALLMLLGVFLPLANVPILGSINYIQSGKGDGTIILGLALVIAALVICGLRLPAVFVGMAAGAVMLYTLVRLIKAFSEVQANAADLAKTNPFGGLAVAFVNSAGLGWGWLPLLGGAALVVGGGLSAPNRFRGSVEVTTTTDPDAVVQKYMAERGSNSSAVASPQHYDHPPQTQAAKGFGRRQRQS